MGEIEFYYRKLDPGERKSSGQRFACVARFRCLKLEVYQGGWGKTEADARGAARAFLLTELQRIRGQRHEGWVEYHHLEQAIKELVHG